MRRIMTKYWNIFNNNKDEKIIFYYLWKVWKIWISVLSIICSKCKNEEENILKVEESIEILKIPGLIEIFKYFKNMSQ